MSKGNMTCLPHPQLNAPLRQNLELKNLFDEEYEAGAFLNYAYPGAPPLAGGHHLHFLGDSAGPSRRDAAPG